MTTHPSHQAVAGTALLKRPRLRRKDWLRLAALAFLVIGVVVLELAVGSVRSFYTNHSLQAGVVTGILLGMFAVFGFQVVRAKLNDRRWEPLSRLALLSLSNQTTLLIDVSLWLVTGQKPVNDAAPAVEIQEELENIRGQAGLLASTDVDLGNVRYPEYSGMLMALMGQLRWRVFANRQLDTWKWRNRQGIAAWAAAMLTTGEAADVLNRLAKLNEWISTIQASLHASPFGQAEPVDAVVKRWMMWRAEAISLREDLVRAGRQHLPAEWVKFRNALHPDDRIALARRDAEITDLAEARRFLPRAYKEQPMNPDVMPDQR